MPPPKPTIIHCYPSFHKQGGVERYLWELSQVQRAEWSVEVLTSHCTEPLPPGIGVKTFPTPRWPGFLTTIFFTFISSIYLTWRGRKPRQVIHVQGANCLLGDIITAHSCHKAWFVRSLQELSPVSFAFWKKLFNPMHWITILIETWQYRSGGKAQVAAISQAVADELREFYQLAADRLSVIYNGVNCREFHPSSNSLSGLEFRQQLGLQPQHLVLLFVANEFRRKGLATLLKAMQLLNHESIRLVVAGRADSQPFRQQAEQLGIAGRVSFIGACSDMPALYAAADIFVFPTQYEPFGLVITEAMAAGLPVVVSRLAGASELLQHESNAMLLNDPQSAEELAALIKKLLDQEVRQRIAAAGLRLVQSMTWQAMADRYTDLYSKVGGTRP